VGLICWCGHGVYLNPGMCRHTPTRSPVPALPSCILEPLWDQFAALLPQHHDTRPAGLPPRTHPRPPGLRQAHPDPGLRLWLPLHRRHHLLAHDPQAPPRRMDRARAGRTPAHTGPERLRPNTQPPAGRSERRRVHHQGLLRGRDRRAQPGGPRQGGPQTLGRQRGQGHPAGSGASTRQPPQFPAASTDPGQDPCRPRQARPTAAQSRVHLAAGYDSAKTRATLAERGLAGQIAHNGIPAPIQSTSRWPVERTHA
jgi:hypothetical protein